MNFSNLSKINRSAISGALTPEAYALAHERAANEVLDNQFEFDQVNKQDLETWIAEQIKEDDLAEVEFFESKAEQLELHAEDLREITKALDKKTQQQLAELQKTQEQRKEAIAKHVQQQKESLAKAIEEKKESDKRLAEAKQQLQQMAIQHKELMAQHIESARLVMEKQQQLKQAEPAAAQAMERVQSHFRGQATDPFSYKGSAFDHPAKHALDRDRAFQNKLETMGDSARQARDPDVRERIEVEMQRQKAQFGIAQNERIAGLTGKPRDGDIARHKEAEQAAALRAAELDRKLEDKVIKVDFCQGNAPDIREIQEHEKMDAKMKADLQVVNEHIQQREEAQNLKENQETVRLQLNDHGRKLDGAENNLTEAVEENTAKSKLLARIQGNIDQARVNNANIKVPESTMLAVKEIRDRQERIELEHQEQMKQKKSVSSGLSHG